MSQHYEIPFTPTRTKVKAFGSDRPIELSGKFEAVVESKKRMTVATLYVTVQENESLLSCNTSVELGLIQFPACNLIVLERKVQLLNRTKYLGLKQCKNHKYL